MNPEIYREFLIRQGHHVVKSDSCYWYNAQPGFFFYFPYHKLITPNKEELRNLFRKEFCIGMRFFTPIENFGKESYLIICSNKDYDLSSLAKKARNQTRRGLENFVIKQLDFKSLASLGIKPNHDTLERQGRNIGIWNRKSWQEYCSAANGLDGFEAWGAFHKDQLAAFMVCFQMEDHFTILHHSSVTEYLRQYPNNALVFHVTNLKLQSEDVSHIFYGPQSLDAPGSLDKFKFNMGFEQKPIKQRIEFSSLVKPFVNKLSYKIFNILSLAKPESDVFRKLEGINKFYLEAN